jgi:hypothetical protein
MLRVGQRYLAWSAYERTASMAQGFWPDAAIQEKLVAHCRGRQALIEQKLTPAERGRLMPTVEGEDELAFGRRYQKEYRDYEARKLSSGNAPDGRISYDSFNVIHGPIASPVGSADTVQLPSDTSYEFLRLFLTPVAWAVFFSGVFAFVAAWLWRWRASRRPLPSPADLGPFRPAPNPSESLRRAEDDG